MSPAHQTGPRSQGAAGRPELSVVVVSYEMWREAPRTLFSLSRSYQESIDDLDYDVVLVDNGSSVPVADELVRQCGPEFRLWRVDEADPSPAAAANQAVAATRGEAVALILDGARMVTPGLLATAMAALRTQPLPFVTAVAWHLGPAHQSISLQQGYSPAVEDALLEQIGWPGEGYRLFDIAALAGANPGGFLGSVNESTCCVMPRQLWDRLGGLDEAFDLPGGGLVALDFFRRAVTMPDVQPVVMLGEGTFHQVHGGASTSPENNQQAWYDQYKALRGRPYAAPHIDPYYVGRLGTSARRWLTGPQ